MNTFLTFFAIFLISCVNSSPPTNSENICKDAQKFKFDHFQVNSVFKIEKEHFFPTIKSLLVNTNYEFGTWTCPINRTMFEEDLNLYNTHIIKVYSEYFFKNDLADFYAYRTYVENIRNSFIDGEQRLKAVPDCYESGKKLQDIVNQINEGYKFLNCLTKIKENRLCEDALIEMSLKSAIDDLPASNNLILSFRNKVINYYYKQQLIKSSFSVKKVSDKYLDLDSTAVIKMTLFLPLHNKNYDADRPCIELKDLPLWYHST